MSNSAHEVYTEELYESLLERLHERVGERRYTHSLGVAQMAVELAEIYGEDPLRARFAGILHDWDKGLGDNEVRARAAELGVHVDPFVVSDMPWLLHGPTAAAALAREFPQFDAAVFQAIARHTSGAADMAALDCIIYVADIIEPDRTFGDAQGIAELRALVGKVPVDELYFHAFKYTLGFLVATDRKLHPDTLGIWNALVVRYGHRPSMKELADIVY